MTKSNEKCRRGSGGIFLIHQILHPNGLERLKVILPRSADFLCAFSVFYVALHLLVA
jgi:hypothetical protein